MAALRVCPNCQKEVESPFEFGMISCSHCGHLFIAEEAKAGTGNSNPTPAVTSPAQPPPSEAPRVHPMTEDSVKLDDISNFGNRSVENLGSGALYYNIEISGIDTPELRNELETVMLDKKLGLSASMLMPKIKSGVLQLTEMHPVKATILVSRLKSTNLVVKWSTGQLIKAMLAIFIAVGFGQKLHASDWARHEVSLKQYSIKINNLQDELLALSQKKSHEIDPKVKEEILEEIKKKYTELKTTHKDLLEEMEHVRFQHPEKGDKTVQQYKHFKLKTLKEIEKDTSVEGQMLRLKRKAEIQYGKSQETGPSEETEDTPVTTP